MNVTDGNPVGCAYLPENVAGGGTAVLCGWVPKWVNVPLERPLAQRKYVRKKKKQIPIAVTKHNAVRCEPGQAYKK